MDETPATLTMDDVATRLGIPVDQVQGLIESGDLKGVNIDGATRITAESVLHYLLSRVTSNLKSLDAPRDATGKIASAFLPLLLGLWLIGFFVMLHSLHGKPIVPGWLGMASLGAVLAFAWWLAARSTSSFSVNGLGTALYGKKSTPMGRIGTQWLIVGGIPLLPLRSYVVLEHQDKASHTIMSRTEQFHVRPLNRIYWAQAAPIMVLVWAALGIVVLLVIR